MGQLLISSYQVRTHVTVFALPAVAQDILVIVTITTSQFLNGSGAVEAECFRGLASNASGVRNNPDLFIFGL